MALHVCSLVPMPCDAVVQDAVLWNAVSCRGNEHGLRNASSTPAHLPRAQRDARHRRHGRCHRRGALWCLLSRASHGVCADAGQQAAATGGSSSRQQLKVGLLTTRWGSWPAFMPFVLRAFASNTAIDFHLISDAPLPWSLPSNARAHLLTVAGFLQLVRSTIGANLTGMEVGGVHSVHRMSTSKISDLKPMMGEIFADILAPYAFWGHVQEDVILGRLGSCIFPLLERFDVISPFGGKLNASGVFMLFRNVRRINRLWRQSPVISRVLSDPAYLVWGTYASPHDPAQRPPSTLTLPLYSHCTPTSSPLPPRTNRRMVGRARRQLPCPRRARSRSGPLAPASGRRSPIPSRRLRPSLVR